MHQSTFNKHKKADQQNIINANKSDVKQYVVLLI